MGGDTSELPIPSRPAPMKTIPIAVSLFGNVAGQLINSIVVDELANQVSLLGCA